MNRLIKRGILRFLTVYLLAAALFTTAASASETALDGRADSAESDPLSEDLACYAAQTTRVSAHGVICTSFVYGRSVQGRELVCWSIRPRRYTRTLLLNFAIHGWEDAYAADGQVLTELGHALVSHYANRQDLHNCRLLIIPCANPDGLAEGTTDSGFGRCNADGVDLNRDFDAKHRRNTKPRYYTRAPFSAPESRALRDLVLASAPNAVLDFHGWLNTTIGSRELAQAFSAQMGLRHKRTLTTGSNGYFTYWAQLQGAQALLVELPGPDSVDCEQVIRAVDQLMAGNGDA